MHDKRKNIAPAYSFGVKHKNFTNNHSPGPKFNIEGIRFNLIAHRSHLVRNRNLGQNAGTRGGRHKIEP